MFNALKSSELDGVLLDTFVAAESKDMLSSNVRVNKIMSYDSSYGIVFRGEMASGELQTCFNNFASTKKGEISDLVDKNTTQVKVNSKIIITTFHCVRSCITKQKNFQRIYKETNLRLGLTVVRRSRISHTQL